MVGRVLIVDDEDTLRLTIKTRLASAGFETDAAVDGEEALEKLKQGPFDVVLLDINMPRMDGITALGLISDMYPQTDVIMLTGFADFTTAIECLKKGAKDYLVKPIDTTELITRMRSLLRARNSEAALNQLKLAHTAFLLDDVLRPVLLLGKITEEQSRGKGSKELAKALSPLTDGLRNLATDVKQTLDSGQLRSKQSVAERKSLALSKSVSAAIEKSKAMAKALDLAVSHTAGKGMKIEGDAAALERAFSLVIGALASISAKGASFEITESASDTAASVKFRLSKCSEKGQKIVDQVSKTDAGAHFSKSFEDVSWLLLAVRGIMEGHGGGLNIGLSKGAITVECTMALHATS